MMLWRSEMICLATYNIWNSSEGMPFRADCIISEIKKVMPDILCLQEVKDRTFSEKIAGELNLNCYFVNFPTENEGICILTKYPFIEMDSWMADANAQYAQLQAGDKTIGVVNLHFPWDSVLSRERCLVSLIEKLKSKKSDYLFVLGDFNCGEHSDVIRMMLGDCSIQGIEAKPCFYDLASAAAQLNGTNVKDTLNFRENPRFHSNTIEINQRFDRIFFRNPYPSEFPKLIECDIFGTRVYLENGLAASDHYGVYAKIEGMEKG